MSKNILIGICVVLMFLVAGLFAVKSKRFANETRRRFFLEFLKEYFVVASSFACGVVVANDINIFVSLLMLFFLLGLGWYSRPESSPTEP